MQLRTRLNAAVDDSKRHLNDEISRLLKLPETGNASASDESLTRVDALRDELNSKLDGIRADMLALLRASTAPSTYGRYANTKAGLLPALGNLCSKKPCLRPRFEPSAALAEGLLVAGARHRATVLGTSSPSQTLKVISISPAGF